MGTNGNPTAGRSGVGTGASNDDGPPSGRKNRRRPSANGRKPRPGWRNGLSIGLMALGIALALGGPLSGVLQHASLPTGALILFASIGIAIVADVVAVAATAGDEAPFNAMASNKVPGAREALVIIRNAGRVNSLLGDVVGDICGTISGMVATPVIVSLHSLYPELPLSVISMAVLGLISFVTIGGKAAEKGYAVRSSTAVILLVGKGIHYFNRLRGVGRHKRPRRG